MSADLGVELFAGTCASGDAAGVAAVKFLVKRENAVSAHGAGGRAALLAAAPAAPDSARLVLLAICASGKQLDDTALAQGALESIERADEATLAAVPLKWAVHLVRALIPAFLRLRPAHEAELVAPLHKLLAATLPAGSLTPLQPLFLQVCLQARPPALESARAVAGAPVYEADHARETQLSAAECQAHFLLGGAAFAQLREWDKAAEAFRQCLLLPAEAPSYAALDAHRRWLLSSVLATGVVPPLPRTVSHANARAIEKNAHSLLFAKLAKACCNTGSLDAAAIARAAAEGAQAQLWGEAAPQGPDRMLVDELLQSAMQRRVLRLSQTYTTVPFSQVAQAMGAGTSDEAAAAMVEGMQREGRMAVGVRVDRTAGMLVFVAGSAAAAAAPGAAVAAAAGAAGEGEGAKRAAAAAAAGAQKLGHEVEELMHAVARLQKADADLTVNQSVLKRLMLLQAEGGRGEAGMGGDLLGGGRRAYARGAGGGGGGGGAGAGMGRDDEGFDFQGIGEDDIAAIMQAMG